jgi:hypothetical protein
MCCDLAQLFVAVREQSLLHHARRRTVTGRRLYDLAVGCSVAACHVAQNREPTQVVLLCRVRC